MQGTSVPTKPKHAIVFKLGQSASINLSRKAIKLIFRYPASCYHVGVHHWAELTLPISLVHPSVLHTQDPSESWTVEEDKIEITFLCFCVFMVFIGVVWTRSAVLWASSSSSLGRTWS